MTRTVSHILLVDDNEDEIYFARRALGRSGADVRFTIARDGAEALDLLMVDLVGDLPDLILLDVNMPRMGGLELLRRLREGDATPRVPIVMFSTSVDARDIRTSYQSGASSYVRKPVSYDEYEETLVRVGSYWLDLNERHPQRMLPSSPAPSRPPATAQ